MVIDAAHLFLLKPISCSCCSRSSLTFGSTCSQHDNSHRLSLIFACQ